MSVFDRRHRWGPVVRMGATIRRTCLSCGRTDIHETLIPDIFVDQVLRLANMPNPFQRIVVQ